MLYFLLSITIMSLNLRIADANDGINSWDNRKAACVAAITDQHPDVVAFQENSLQQDTFLTRALTHYERVCVTADDNNPVTRNNTLYYRADRFRLVRANMFWLSETPNRFSKGWDGAYARFAVYALLEDQRTAERYLVMNTHIDHIGNTARKQSVQLIMDSLAVWMHEPLAGVMLMGDFNSLPDDEVLLPVREHMKSAQETKHKAGGTFHNWGQDSKTIDYIFYRNCKPASFRVVKKGYGVPFISDHYPIVGRFK